VSDESGGVPEEVWRRLERDDLDLAAQALAVLVEEQEFERRVPIARAVLESVVVAVSNRIARGPLKSTADGS